MATPLPASLIVRKGELIVPAHRVSIGPLEERILWGLAAQIRRHHVGDRYEWRRCPLMTHELIDLCYGDDPDGGPERAGRIIQSKICTLTKTLRPLGWEIVSDGHRGYILQETP